MLFQDRVWVWCIISATKIIELISLKKQEVQNNTLKQITALFFFYIQVMRGENTSSSSNVVQLPIQETI